MYYIAPKNFVLSLKIESHPKILFNKETFPAYAGSNPNHFKLEIDGAVFCAGNRNEDIDSVWNQGLAVDDDNEPAPGNIKRICHIFIIIHPFGNKYYSMCCGVRRVMINVELVEGKNTPVKLDKPNYDNCRVKTCKLLLQMLSN